MTAVIVAATNAGIEIAATKATTTPPEMMCMRVADDGQHTASNCYLTRSARAQV